jgi:hypothetical protein
LGANFHGVVDPVVHLAEHGQQVGNISVAFCKDAPQSLIIQHDLPAVSKKHSCIV